MNRAATIKILALSAVVAAAGCRILPSPEDFVLPRPTSHHPDNPHALFMEGKSSLIQGEPRKAVRRFRAALRLQPHFEEAQLGLAHAYREAGSYTRAQKVYRAVLERSPRNAQALEGLALVLIERDRPDEARPLLERVVEEINPKSVTALNALADLHYGRREYRLACRYWRRSLELDRSQDAIRALCDDLERYVAKYLERESK